MRWASAPISMATIFSSLPVSTGSTSASFPATSANSPAKWERWSPIPAARGSSIEPWPRCAPLLKENGYCGYINLNTIVNESGIWPLEFTCRFGYPGYAILDPLQRTAWADLFRSMLDRNAARFEVGTGILPSASSSPRRPSLIRESRSPSQLDCRSLFDDDLSPAERRNLHYGEVGLSDGVLVTSGASGYTLVVTGTGETIAVAQAAANALAGKILVPNARYRLDIGQRLIQGEFARLESWGLLDPD